MQLSEKQLKFIFEKYQMQFVKKLGSGGFGTVYLANSVGQQFLPLAVKCITRKKLNSRPSLQKYLSQQIASMSSLQHCNIVKLLKTFTEGQCIFLVMEYCEYGNLYSYQYSLPDKVFKLDQGLSVFLQVLCGLKAIHQENIIHRDIKCQNILLKKLKQGAYTCKIGDFGFAKQLNQTAKSHCGTPNFMAPQIFAQKPYDKCIDVWSVGVILYYMLFADYPFKGLNILYDIETKCTESYDLLRQNNSQLIKKRNRSIGDKQLLMLANLFKLIFVIDPTKRVTISQLFKHPMFLYYQQKVDAFSLPNELNSDFEDQRINFLRQLEFIQKVESSVRQCKILTYEHQLLLKYFLQKINLSLINNYLKGDSLSDKKDISLQIIKKAELIQTSIKNDRSELQILIPKNVFNLNINFTHISSANDKFQQFKDIYRTVLGYVFTQVHSSQLKQKERLKLKILCCHTINRVFENPNAKFLSFFNNWSQGKTKLKKTVDFELFELWTNQESIQNISRTTSLINEYFYSKK